MDTFETIQTIRNINIIEGTTVDYGQGKRNAQLVESYGRVNVTNLTSQEALNLGFGIWDRETNLHLIPFYLYDFLEYGQTLTSISGDMVTVTEGYSEGIGSNPNYIDNDYRGGCLAYGFVPRE